MPGSLREREGGAVGEDELLEESAASGGGPIGTVTPGGCRAGWAESVLQPASLGGVTTGGTIASVEQRRRDLWEEEGERRRQKVYWCLSVTATTLAVYRIWTTLGRLLGSE